LELAHRLRTSSPTDDNNQVEANSARPEYLSRAAVNINSIVNSIELPAQLTCT
jgi:hypothetical protein